MKPIVHLFIPCYVDQLYPQVGVATVRILEHLGCRVKFPAEQTCCGQPAYNSGYWDQARPIAEHFVKTFAEAEYIVAPSGSCVSMVKLHYRDLLAGSASETSWQSLSSRIFELSQFLNQVLEVDAWKGRFPARVTYHDSCHALRELGVEEGPRQLLRSIADLELVEMEQSDTCCGFGGVFSVKFPGISIAMAENKAGWIQESGAEYLIATDVSCLMHLQAYLDRHNIPVKALHFAEVLERAGK